ncbi:uncharacterized protein MONBRDRAFT_31491 [Monosiga brevicollis MX1]|uniref:Uncharacterized protein n=1 Tax=Monosiga brevicollis TaxID=81824 RepID=A9UTI9_MONBE|nr:uncharacterized protein MONBRDRAFT_31491 [Monosiga brevicollis MX1]EDQ91255.1 predicted protein [Monosiga brevicollis MX1]|eukprot:XP_001743677.1 hypothetical protein [Monosiga brevicollis MX1]
MLRPPPLLNEPPHQLAIQQDFVCFPHLLTPEDHSSLRSKPLFFLAFIHDVMHANVIHATLALLVVPHQPYSPPPPPPPPQKKHSQTNCPDRPSLTPPPTPTTQPPTTTHTYTHNHSVLSPHLVPDNCVLAFCFRLSLSLSLFLCVSLISLLFSLSLSLPSPCPTSRPKEGTHTRSNMDLLALPDELWNDALAHAPPAEARDPANPAPQGEGFRWCLQDGFAALLNLAQQYPACSVLLDTQAAHTQANVQHVPALALAAEVYIARAPQASCCSLCWAPTANLALGMHDLRLCNDCLSHFLLSETRVRHMFALSESDVRDLEATHQLHTIGGHGSQRYFFAPAVAHTIASRSPIPLSQADETNSAVVADRVAAVHGYEQALLDLQAMKRVCLLRSCSTYGIDLDELAQRHADLEASAFSDWRKPNPLWRRIFQRCLQFCSRPVNSTRLITELQADILVVELFSALCFEQRAIHLHHLLADAGLPTCWITPHAAVDTSVAEVYPELTSYIMQPLERSSHTDECAQTMVKHVLQLETARQTKLALVRTKLQQVCRGNMDLLRRCRAHPAYKSLLKRRRIGDVMDTVVEIMTPVFEQLAATTCDMPQRQALVDGVLRDQLGTEPPSPEELLFFSAWGRAEIHPCALYLQFIAAVPPTAAPPGAATVSAQLAAQQWAAFAGSTSRSKLQHLLQLVGAHALVQLLYHDFSGLVKLHLIRFLAAAREETCAFHHSRLSALSATMRSSASSHPVYSWGAAPTLDPNETMPSPLADKAMSANDIDTLVATQEVHLGMERSLTDGTVVAAEPSADTSEPMDHHQDVDAAPHSCAAASDMPTMEQGADHDDAMPTAASTPTAEVCHCHADAAHHMAHILSGFAVRVHDLQCALGDQRVVARLTSAQAQKVARAYTCAPLNRLTAKPIRADVQVASIKLKGLFNLNLDLDELPSLDVSAAPTSAHEAARLIHLYEDQFIQRLHHVTEHFVQAGLHLDLGWIMTAHAQLGHVAGAGLAATLSAYAHGLVDLTPEELDYKVQLAAQREQAKSSRARALQDTFRPLASVLQDTVGQTDVERHEARATIRSLDALRFLHHGAESSLEQCRAKRNKIVQKRRRGELHKGRRRDLLDRLGAVTEWHMLSHAEQTFFLQRRAAQRYLKHEGVDVMEGVAAVAKDLDTTMRQFPELPALVADFGAILINRD